MRKNSVRARDLQIDHQRRVVGAGGGGEAAVYDCEVGADEAVVAMIAVLSMVIASAGSAVAQHSSCSLRVLGIVL
jgi:hypothetical protein